MYEVPGKKIMRKSFINWKGHLVLLVMFCIATCVFFYLWIFVFVVFVFTYFFFYL